MNRPAIKRFLQKGWPFLLPLLLFGLPPFASKGYGLLEAGYILTHSIKHLFQPLYPAFKIVPLLLALSLFLIGNKAAKPFGLFAAFSYLLFGLLQGISLDEKYGLGICLAHLLLSVMIAVFWLGEVRSPKNEYARRSRPLWKYWVIIPALIAFWEPAQPVTGSPDFNPAYLLTSGAGLAFCMMTPFYLAVLILCHPRVNPTILAMTSAVGVLYAMGNLTAAFIFHSGRDWWIGILHLPLLMVACYGLMLSLGDAVSRPGSIGMEKVR
jgi:hypothetical protein